MTMKCDRCGRDCRKLHSMLTPGQGPNYWRVEVCGPCKQAIQRLRERRLRKLEKQYNK
jgi:hypothetical protein